MAFGSSGTSLTGLKGVFWENGLREVEGRRWDEIKDYFESQVEELKFNMGVLELGPERKRYLGTIKQGAFLRDS